MLVSIKDIIIPADRQRKEFKDKELLDLSASIYQHGLINPIIVSINANKITLIAGERRLRAIQLSAALHSSYKHGDETIPVDMIPATTIADAGNDLTFFLEYAENAFRAPLSWKELAVVTGKLNSMLTAHNNGNTPTVTAVTQAVLAYSGKQVSAVGGRVSKTARDLLISNHLDNPRVSSAGTANRALSAIRLIQAEEAASKLAEANKERAIDRDYRNNIFCGDFFTVQREQFPSSLFDIIMLDPPYGIGADAFNYNKHTGAQQAYDDSVENANTLIEQFAKLTPSITNDNSWLFCFLDFNRFHYHQDIFTANGWTVLPYPLIWSKQTGNLPYPNKFPRKSYECILMASRGNPQLRITGNSVFQVDTIMQKEHGAEKPVPLLVSLLKQVAFTGMAMLDPFMGSGSAIKAGLSLDLICYGVEKSPEYFSLAALKTAQTTGDAL